MNLRISRIFYILVWLLTGIFATLSETDILPVGYVQLNNEQEYALHMICIILTLGATWISLRWFAFTPIRRILEAKPYKQHFLCIIRTLILGSAIGTNLVAYYALMNGTSTLFCLLITLTGFVFCWPQKNE